jgi:thioredoxin reductase (NADPH)
VRLGARPRWGGDLPRINLPIRDYLAASAIDGRAFLLRVEQELQQRAIPMRLDTPAIAIDPQAHRVTTGSEVLAARTIVLAMGARRRPLDRPGLREHVGRGVTDSATRDLERLAGQPAVVIGGGDGAFENALLLATRCPQVYLVHRGPAPRARPEFVGRVFAHENIEVIREAQVVSVRGNGDQLTEVAIDVAGRWRTLAAAWLVVKIGFEPNTDAISGSALARDPAGYLLVDQFMRTSVDGVYAIGDLRNPRAPCLAAAVGDGAVAGQEIARYLRPR